MNARLKAGYRKINYAKRRYVMRPVGAVLATIKRFKKNRPKKKVRTIRFLLRGKEQKRFLLLNPGPVLTSDEVKNSLIQYDLCHRDEAFSDIIAELKKDCLKLFKAPSSYRVMFISGSGTAALESGLCSTIPKGKKVLVVSNGAFGERIADILKLHGIPMVYKKLPWGKNIDVSYIEKQLRKDRRIYAIALNHHETSAGILNPISEVGTLSKKYRKLFIVDAISSLGAEKIDVVKDNIDVCITSSNKCLHSVTGVSLVCAKKSVLDGLKKIPARNFYLDLYKHYQYIEKKNQTPYTPNVISFFALRQAVKELLASGLDKRHKEYVKRNALLKTELSKLGFDFFTDYGNESHTILTVKVPRGIDYDELYTGLKGLGFLIYDCKPPMYKKYFQIANMGELNEAMIFDFVFSVKQIMKKMVRVQKKSTKKGILKRRKNKRAQK